MAVDASQDDSNFKLYSRLLYWKDGNKSAGVQVTTINDKLYVGLGKFWRQTDWKANRWAPGKKGNHIFLSVDQYRALVSAIPKISIALQLVESRIGICADDFEDISDTGATVASVRSGTVVSGTEPAYLSAGSTTTVDESTAAVRGVDACDGELQELRELREPSANQDKDKKAQDAPSTVSKRKRGRPSKVSGQESATPKAGKPRASKTKPDGTTGPASAPAGVSSAPADISSASAGIVLEHGASPAQDKNRVDNFVR